MYDQGEKNLNFRYNYKVWADFSRWADTFPPLQEDRFVTKDERVSTHLRMLPNRARPYLTLPIDITYVFDAGVWGLYRSVESWDSGKGCFSDHADRHVRSRMNKAASRLMREHTRLELVDHVAINSDGEEFDLLENTVADHRAERIMDITEASIDVRALLDSLEDPRERYVVEEYFLNGRTLGEIGRDPSLIALRQIGAGPLSHTMVGKIKDRAVLELGHKVKREKHRSNS